MLGIIFRKAQNKVQDPAKLRRLIALLIDREQWSSISSDVKGDACEVLLEKNAADVKDSANLPAPGVLALEIAEDLEAALVQFAAIAEDLKSATGA